MNVSSEAREWLSDLADGVDGKTYLDRIWALRYPTPMPRASDGWPIKRGQYNVLPIKKKAKS